MISSELRGLKNSSCKFGTIIFVICVALFLVALFCRPHRFHSTGKIVGSLACVVFPVFMGWLQHQCGSNKLAFKLMAKATEKHLMNHSGLWPRSFEALEPYADHNGDLHWAAARVKFNYDADAIELAHQHSQDFNGIKYNTPCFVPNEETRNLLSVLKDYAGGAG